ncbi:MAG: alkaline phosphatase [Parvularcula sp.]|jgi:alkaline phosphatase|nr:alkaline phosphatase [Parvularcula sp.]
MDFLFALGMQASVAVTDWEAEGRAALEAARAKAPIEGQAKNVIIFIADGMDVTSSTAGRILDGQMKGRSGEENLLAFEGMPFTGFAKTYNTNLQVPDSAGTATAILSGHKTKAGMINIDQTVARGDCADSEGHGLSTLLDVADRTGRAAGVISTARITHATPAAFYAQAADRDWENDRDVPEGAACQDIAQQLIERARSTDLKLALGGGRRNFFPAAMNDPEYPSAKGARGDGKDLRASWRAISNRHHVAYTKDELMAAEDEDVVLGLFEPSHMKYEHDRSGDQGGEPSIAEMTAFAIERLAREEGGYVLLVEGGRVDHAHHSGNAYRALTDLIAFDDAVEIALEMTDPKETLIVVTADHGHTLAFQGYPKRGNPILGLVRTVDNAGQPEELPLQADDQKPYTTLSYANGPGAKMAPPVEGAIPGREFLDDVDAEDFDHKQQALIPMFSETHGGQDVAIYARGPKAHYFTGVHEQNVIYYIIEDALKR